MPCDRPQPIIIKHIGFGGFRDKTDVVITDNELRYLLWRSYLNLSMPNNTLGLLGEAEDVAKQYELKVGNYAEHGIEVGYAAEPTSERKQELRTWPGSRMPICFKI